MSGGILESLPTVAVNAGVFVGMVIATLAGAKFAKKAKEPEVAPTAQALVGGVLQDNTSVILAAEANRVLAERVGTNTHCVERNTDQLKDLSHEIDRLNRNIERLKDL